MQCSNSTGKLFWDNFGLCRYAAWTITNAEHIKKDTNFDFIRALVYNKKATKLSRREVI